MDRLDHGTVLVSQRTLVHFYKPDISRYLDLFKLAAFGPPMTAWEIQEARKAFYEHGNIHARFGHPDKYIVVLKFDFMPHTIVLTWDESDRIKFLGLGLLHRYGLKKAISITESGVLHPVIQSFNLQLFERE